MSEFLTPGCFAAGVDGISTFTTSRLVLARAGVLQTCMVCRETSWRSDGKGSACGDGNGAGLGLPTNGLMGDAACGHPTFATASGRWIFGRAVMSSGGRILSKIVITPAQATRAEVINDSRPLAASSLLLSGSALRGSVLPPTPKIPPQIARHASSNVRRRVRPATRSTKPDASTKAAAAAANSSSAIICTAASLPPWSSKDSWKTSALAMSKSAFLGGVTSNKSTAAGSSSVIDIARVDTWGSITGEGDGSGTSTTSSASTSSCARPRDQWADGSTSAGPAWAQGGRAGAAASILESAPSTSLLPKSAEPPHMKVKQL
mmetsp:Transcript_44031/g.82318  ORF Transcript_44031/g.82318 Transcript_44031/m.82318 type:complete len:319 (-) Transcript_44031:525-1481(-)